VDLQRQQIDIKSQKASLLAVAQKFKENLNMTELTLEEQEAAAKTFEAFGI